MTLDAGLALTHQTCVGLYINVINFKFYLFFKFLLLKKTHLTIFGVIWSHKAIRKRHRGNMLIWHEPKLVMIQNVTIATKIEDTKKPTLKDTRQHTKTYTTIHIRANCWNYITTQNEPTYCKDRHQTLPLNQGDSWSCKDQRAQIHISSNMNTYFSFLFLIDTRYHWWVSITLSFFAYKIISHLT